MLEGAAALGTLVAFFGFMGLIHVAAAARATRARADRLRHPRYWGR